MAKRNKKTATPVEEAAKKIEEKVSDVIGTNPIADEDKEAEEVLNEFTSPENIENLEKELNEVYANTEDKEEEEPENIIDLGVAQEVIENFGDANKRLNEIVNNTKPENLQETLQEELIQASAIEDKLKERISDLEKKIPPQTRSNLNARMTNLWCGIRYT